MPIESDRNGHYLSGNGHTGARDECHVHGRSCRARFNKLAKTVNHQLFRDLVHEVHDRLPHEGLATRLELFGGEGIQIEESPEIIDNDRLWSVLDHRLEIAASECRWHR